MEIFQSQEFKLNPLLIRMVSGTNKSVSELNDFIRKGLWGKNYSQEYNEGEILMGYDNWGVDYETKLPSISNGGDYIVQSAIKSSKIINGVKFEGHDLVIKNLIDEEALIIRAFALDRNTKKENIIHLGEEFERLRKEALNKKGKEAAILWKRLSYLKEEFLSSVPITDKNGRVKIKASIKYGYGTHDSQISRRNL